MTDILNLAAGESAFAAGYTYSDAGEYLVTVSVSDGDGGEHSRSFTLTVTGYPVFTPLLWKDTLP